MCWEYPFSMIFNHKRTLHENLDKCAYYAAF